jgi:hypothetical protein
MPTICPDCLGDKQLLCYPESDSYDTFIKCENCNGLESIENEQEERIYVEAA